MKSYKKNILIKSLLFEIVKKVVSKNINYVIAKKINQKKTLPLNVLTLSRAALPLHYNKLINIHFLLNIIFIPKTASLKSIVFDKTKLYLTDTSIEYSNLIPLVVKYENYLFNSNVNLYKFIEYIDIFFFIVKMNQIFYNLRILKPLVDAKY